MLLAGLKVLNDFAGRVNHDRELPFEQLRHLCCAIRLRRDSLDDATTPVAGSRVPTGLSLLPSRGRASNRALVEEQQLDAAMGEVLEIGGCGSAGG